MGVYLRALICLANQRFPPNFTQLYIFKGNKAKYNIVSHIAIFFKGSVKYFQVGMHYAHMCVWYTRLIIYDTSNGKTL